MEVFLLAHQNYNYEELFLEIENISMHLDESINEFYARFMSVFFIYHLEDWPSTKDLIECFTSIVLPFKECKKSYEDEQDVIDPLVNFDSTSNFIETTNGFETVSQSHTLGFSFTHFQIPENDSLD